MNEEVRPPIPGWFRLIAVLAILWNLMGCVAFSMEMFAQEAMMEGWTEPQKEWARSIPAWLYVIYGVAVGAGALGSLGLLLKKVWSRPVFLVSFIAILAQMIYSMFIAGGFEVMGPSALLMPSLVTVIAIALLWVSRLAQARGWLG